MPSIFYPAGETPSDELFIFLPGRGDDMNAFEINGFIETLREARPDVDAIAIDAHMTYYRKGLIGDQVFRDIIEPYQRKGYQHFTLVGISLGGYGSLWLSSVQPEEISNIVLLAPFLGMNPLVERIEEKGGIKPWRAQLDPDPEFDELAWVWADDLRDKSSQQIENVILGYGEGDRFAGAAELLASALPPSNVFAAEGGHDWETWKKLWSEIVQSPEFVSWSGAQK
jgi:pimeloyl-ACP methyl ester carboxylesterase